MKRLVAPFSGIIRDEIVGWELAKLLSLGKQQLLIYKHHIMAVQKYAEAHREVVREGLERRIIYTENLMTAIVEFTDGPWSEAEPFHSHSHEQTSYVAEGEIIFYCEGEPEQHLRSGDMFSAKSGQKHTIRLLTPRARLIDSFNPIRQDFIK